MAYCTNCHKGIAYGHAVSHAKNRVRRFFRPNIQKIKLLRNGITIRVKLCTACIKTLRKYNKLGLFTLPKIAPALSIIEPKLKVVPLLREVSASVKEKVSKTEVKKQKAAEKLQIEDIVGKKS